MGPERGIFKGLDDFLTKISDDFKGHLKYILLKGSAGKSLAIFIQAFGRLITKRNHFSALKFMFYESDQTFSKMRLGQNVPLQKQFFRVFE